MVLCAEEEAFSAYGLCEYGAAVLVSSALRVPPYSVECKVPVVKTCLGTKREGINKLRASCII